MNRKKRAGILVSLLSLSLGLLLSEFLLRRLGYRWQTQDHPNEPVLHEPDPVLGWRAKPGRYIFPAYRAGLPNIRMTLWEDGLRATSPTRVRREKTVVVLGCSYVQGWALSDEETFPWRLQRKFPSVEIINYGTSGYGTYQSLLTLESHLRRNARAPRLILYGLVQHHQLRNVADPLWLLLLSLSARRGHVAAPYCLLGSNGALERHPPEAYPYPALDKASSLVALLRATYYKPKRHARIAQAGPVTEKLLQEMDTLARNKKSRLAVVLLDLDPGPRAHYSEFLKARGIEYIDCIEPDMHHPEFQVPGEGHPNGLVNLRWARCIEAHILKS